ncbi:MAG TPA: hypothetical protein VEW48_24205 [Thermoanaerobaculia bacterium]|nr:hypothetical protein [Thermoanaerobaculia bacterium]
MWHHLVAAVALSSLGITAPPVVQEQVSIELPQQIAFDSAAIGGSSDPTRPVVVSFHQAQLLPGRALRLSVLAEGAPPDCRLLFTTRNARGGIGRAGRAGVDDFSPVFESFPSALSGGFEISWVLEMPGEIRRAGRQAMRLRWRIESVAVPESMERRGGSAGNPHLSPGGEEPPTFEPVPGRRTPVVREHDEFEPEGRRRPPAQEVP